jgi:CRP/FNR family transcriptional regulator, cyclic AMP receptor protein
LRRLLIILFQVVFAVLLPDSNHFTHLREDNVTGTLAGIGVFRNLTPERIAGVEKLSDWRVVEGGHEIVAHMDTSRDVNFLVSGKARSIIYAASGTVVAFGEILPGMMFGEIAAIDGHPRTVGVEALETCTVATLSHQHFLALLRQEPEFAMALITQIAHNIRGLQERVFEFSTLPVNNRVQAELLRLAETKGRPKGSTVLLPEVPTHADFAARVSTHREAVTREIGRLVKIGILEKSNEGLEIIDIAGLRALVKKANEA